jgi:hypothetical protein
MVFRRLREIEISNRLVHLVYIEEAHGQCSVLCTFLSSGLEFIFSECLLCAVYSAAYL